MLCNRGHGFLEKPVKHSFGRPILRMQSAIALKAFHFSELDRAGQETFECGAIRLPTAF